MSLEDIGIGAAQGRFFPGFPAGPRRQRRVEPFAGRLVLVGANQGLGVLALELAIARIFVGQFLHQRQDFLGFLDNFKIVDSLLVPILHGFQAWRLALEHRTKHVQQGELFPEIQEYRRREVPCPGC